MKEKFLMYMVLLWIVGTVMSLIIAGQWLGDTQSDVMNQLMVLKIAKIGVWSVPVPNADFFTFGLAALFAWDFSFLSGSVLLWLFYLLNIGMTFVLVSIFVGVITSIFH
jgi:hypothetical protein